MLEPASARTGSPSGAGAASDAACVLVSVDTLAAHGSIAERRVTDVVAWASRAGGRRQERATASCNARLVGAAADFAGATARPHHEVDAGDASIDVAGSMAGCTSGVAVAAVAREAVGARVVAATAVYGVDMGVDAGPATLERGDRAFALARSTDLSNATGREATPAMSRVAAGVDAFAAALQEPFGTRHAAGASTVTPGCRAPAIAVQRARVASGAAFATSSRAASTGEQGEGLIRATRKQRQREPTDERHAAAKATLVGVEARWHGGIVTVPHKCRRRDATCLLMRASGDHRGETGGLRCRRLGWARRNARC